MTGRSGISSKAPAKSDSGRVCRQGLPLRPVDMARSEAREARISAGKLSPWNGARKTTMAKTIPSELSLPHIRWKIAPRGQAIPEFVEVARKVGLKRRNRLSIYSSRQLTPLGAGWRTSLGDTECGRRNGPMKLGPLVMRHSRALPSTTSRRAAAAASASRAGKPPSAIQPRGHVRQWLGRPSGRSGIQPLVPQGGRAGRRFGAVPRRKRVFVRSGCTKGFCSSLFVVEPRRPRRGQICRQGSRRPRRDHDGCADFRSPEAYARVETEMTRGAPDISVRSCAGFRTQEFREHPRARAARPSR